MACVCTEAKMCAFHQVELDRARHDLEDAARAFLKSRGAAKKKADARLRGIVSRIDKIRSYGERCRDRG